MCIEKKIAQLINNPIWILRIVTYIDEKNIYIKDSKRYFKRNEKLIIPLQQISIINKSERCFDDNISV